MKSSARQLRQIVSLVSRNPRHVFRMLDMYVQEGRGASVTFVNPYSIAEGVRSHAYIEDLGAHDLVYADGMLLARVASQVRRTSVPRLSFDGNSLAPEVFEYCHRNSLDVFLVGGKPGIAAKAAQRIGNEYGLKIAGTRSGYFKLGELDRFFRDMVELAPSVMIIGTGVPLQENIAVGLERTGWRGVSFTCGGYLDQIVERGVRYYPQWINEYNLRALYRVWKEPLRLGKRYAVDYLPFYLGVVALMLRGWK